MKDELAALLEEEVPEIDFRVSADWTADGVINSLRLTEIIALISMEFDISIPYEDITEENFSNLDSLARLVEHLTSSGTK